MTVWTEECAQLAASMWTDGRSASRIAEALKSQHGVTVTRNAVLGKLNRLGLLGERRPDVVSQNIREGQRLRFGPPKAKSAPINPADHPWRTKGKAAPKPKAKKPKAERHNNLVAFNLAQRKDAEAMKPRVVKSKPEPIVWDATLAKVWTQRGAFECAFPISGEGADTVSCCHPTKGKTYCPTHHAVMYSGAPVEPVKRLMRLARAA